MTANSPNHKPTPQECALAEQAIQEMIDAGMFDGILPINTRELFTPDTSPYHDNTPHVDPYELLETNHDYDELI